uniref:Uncharacterized protein n=1 Tax=Oryza glumipatula TaxID=40148 RepID=A0A0E0AUF2_9ORYZ
MRPEGGGWRYCHARRLVVLPCVLFATDAGVWLVTALALLLFSVVAGYIVLLSNWTPHWLPVVRTVDTRSNIVLKND